jgi:hypothetical protein
MGERNPKRVSVGVATELLEVFWPNFVEENGHVYAAFQRGMDSAETHGSKTEWECFVNHTHVMDEFSNAATFRHWEKFSEELDAVEETYDEKHPDFIAACEIGRRMAQLWATKLKIDFPNERFRIYYTQYDNPVVRFHKVRPDERVWLTDRELLNSSDRSFKDAVIYDTDRLAMPTIKT